MKFKVSYTVWADHDTDPDEIRSYVENELSGEDVVVAPVEEDVPWPPEEGWYLAGDKTVVRWKAEEFKDEDTWDIESRKWFLRNYTHVNPPTPYEAAPATPKYKDGYYHEAAPATPKYKDGYYRMDDSHLYRRDAGVWTFCLQCSGDWVESSCSDSTISRDFSVRYLGVDAP